MKDKKILKLTLKKKWYDMIKSGAKKEEYIEITAYWRSRLIDTMTHYGLIIKDIKFKDFTHVQFFNEGHFSEKLSNMTYELDGIDIDFGRKEWGADAGVQYFVLKLKAMANEPLNANH
jgi:hypothetical protein